MTATIVSTANFQQEISITPIDLVAGSFHLEVTSQLLSGKDPNAKRRNFSLILEREGLKALKKLIDRSLKSSRSPSTQQPIQASMSFTKEKQ